LIGRTANLTITSNASASPTTVVALSGTGVQTVVDLAWDAPAAGTDPMTGYNIYRATGTSLHLRQAELGRE
jgi:hypothetical protein